MKKERIFSSFDGTKLHMVTDFAETAKGVAVIVHGLCEHLGRYDYVTGRLLESGYTVYRFDHRGHGKSEGTSVYYSVYTEISDDVNAVVELAKSEHPALPLFVIGHSMGGYAATCFATRFPGKADGIVLSGALTRYNTPSIGVLPLDLPADTYLPNALGDGVCSDSAVVAAYLNDPLVRKEISVGLINSLYEGVEWLKGNAEGFCDATLILHGCCDGLVSEKDSRELFGDIASEDKTLKIYARLFHEIFNEPAKDIVINEMIQWLDEHSDT